MKKKLAHKRGGQKSSFVARFGTKNDNVFSNNLLFVLCMALSISLHLWIAGVFRVLNGSAAESSPKQIVEFAMIPVSSDLIKKAEKKDTDKKTIQGDSRVQSASKGSRTRTNPDKTKVKSAVQFFAPLMAPSDPRRDRLGSERTHRNGGTDWGIENNWTPDDRGSWGSFNRPLQQLQFANLHDRIMEKLQGLFYYPWLLGYEHIEGTSNARLFFSPSGNCDFHKTWINAGNPHVRIFALSILKKLCSEGFSHYMTADRVETFVDISLKLELIDPNFDNKKREVDFRVGNTILLTRYQSRSKFDVNLGPIKMNLLAPGFFSVDFEWLKVNWEKAIEKKDPFDEFEKEIQPAG